MFANKFLIKKHLNFIEIGLNLLLNFIAVSTIQATAPPPPTSTLFGFGQNNTTTAPFTFSTTQSNGHTPLEVSKPAASQGNFFMFL